MATKLMTEEIARLEQSLGSLARAYKAVNKIAESSKSIPDMEAAKNALIEIKVVGRFLRALGTSNSCQSGIRSWDGRNDSESRM